jgi:hypothetical protein
MSVVEMSVVEMSVVEMSVLRNVSSQNVSSRNVKSQNVSNQNVSSRTVVAPKTPRKLLTSWAGRRIRKFLPRRRETGRRLGRASSLRPQSGWRRGTYSAKNRRL